jgi:hypothetical protein
VNILIDLRLRYALPLFLDAFSYIFRILIIITFQTLFFDSPYVLNWGKIWGARSIEVMPDSIFLFKSAYRTRPAAICASFLTYSVSGIVVFLQNELFALPNPLGDNRQNLCEIDFFSYLAVLVRTLIKDERAFPVDSDASPGMNTYIFVAFLNFRYRRIFLNIILTVTFPGFSYNAQFPTRAETKVYFIGKPDLILIFRVRFCSAMKLCELHTLDTSSVF